MNHRIQRKPYSKYKQSGVEWLGNVPEHWNVKRLKYSAITIMGQSPNSNDYSDDPELIPFLQGNADFTDRFPTPRIYCDTANKIVPKGSLLISVRAPVGALNEADQEYGIGRGLCAVIPQQKLEKQYTWFAIQVAKEDLNKLATGSTYDAVSADEVGNMLFPLPPLPEQRAIANYLDRETGRIDALINKKQKLVELLKEKRTALISRAVTKGLNASVKLKPSGVEWLGDVPEHWGVKALRYICKIETGDKDTVDSEDDGNYPFFVRSQTIERINSFTNDCEAVLTAGDGVGVGKVFHYVNGKFDFHQRVYMFSKFKKVTGKFFFQFLKENFWRIALEGGAKSTVDSLRRPMIAGFPIVIPPLPEQRAIAAFLDRETGKIDALIAKVEEVVEKLKEYRSALISAAVTGKIDVRDYSNTTELD